METLTKSKTIFYKKSRPKRLRKKGEYNINYITDIGKLDIERIIEVKEDGEFVKNRINQSDVIESNFTGEIFHGNYLQYLNQAYKNDQGIEVKPDYIWYTILCEISRLIKKDPETFRKYFTDSEEKTKITVLKNENSWVLPVDKVKNILLEKIPIGLKEESIIPNFSTTTPDSTFSFNCVFLDSMSPFYTYDMYGCGYKKINIYGNISDYEKMIINLNDIGNLITELKDYTNQCISTIKDVIENWDVKDFWENILTSKTAYLVDIFDGWFTNFYKMDRPKNEPGRFQHLERYKIKQGWYENEFPSHITKVSYDVISPITKEVMAKMILYSGILNSTIEKDCMVPSFNYFVTNDVVDNEFYKYKK